jgi:uncharacterized membrane protein YhaH (DUF805 family)
VDLDWKTLLLSPQGRIARREFWPGFAAVMVASIVLNLIPILGQLLGLLLLWPQFCIRAKRLHDMGKTALLLLIPLAVTILGSSLSAISGGRLAFGVPFLVGVAFLLWVGLTPGQTNPNRYGPPPFR